TINRALTQGPKEIGFNVDWMPATSSGTSAPGSSGGGGGGGRGRRGSGGGGGRGSPGAFVTHREGYEGARRNQLLTAAVRNPPARLMIVDTPGAVTITNELGQSRTLHPEGRQEPVDIEGVSVMVTTKRDAGRLTVGYQVAQDRELHYTYSRVE